ncbi:hypothetical protein CHARACLAT_017507 [Characodon lateralis]|uniref:Uncharacterized protein n=1 Tax=Characodon lateralis TaxID=208331 RepID=A0ABU7D1Y1_9TELE|nr:hypothetical protein [Characodon lateralis]
MWVRQLNRQNTRAILTHGLRKTISEQDTQLITHESVLLSLGDQQHSTNQCLDHITALLLKLQTQPSISPPVEVPRIHAPSHHTTFRNIISPTPERILGMLGPCGGFLLYCSLVFILAPHSFPLDDA